MKNFTINLERLMKRIQQLSEIGALPGGGVCRLAFSDEDRQGRELLVKWMEELDLEIHVDGIGNIMGTRTGQQDTAPVMIGSHLDTVGTGGNYDGNLGVLAGLEILTVLDEAGIETKRPITVANFSNEEGVRFTPDMMGSQVYTGHLPLQEALAAKAMDNSKTIKQELQRIGFAGKEQFADPQVHSYLELHIEQGPVLETEQLTIGAVESVQGLSWREYTILGRTNHAGTTPMNMRRDAGYAACAIANFVRQMALQMGGSQVATVGILELQPNLINVMADHARLTVDLRNTDETLLQEAERRLDQFVTELEQSENVSIARKILARFQPVIFDPQIVELVQQTALALGYSAKRMHSGAGHDAQMLAPVCPSAMIFVPSSGGISHNIQEFTEPNDIEAGANVLLNAALKLTNS